MIVDFVSGPAGTRTRFAQKCPHEFARFPTTFSRRNPYKRNHLERTRQLCSIKTNESGNDETHWKNSLHHGRGHHFRCLQEFGAAGGSSSGGRSGVAGHRNMDDDNSQNPE